MKMNYWPLLLLCLASACTQKKADVAPPPPAAHKGLHFAFSQHAPIQGSASADNWCRVPFPEAAVINADPNNVNRRLFTLANGPHRVTISYGNIVASFVVNRNGNQVELFTSDNYPECLSNRINFTIADTGDRFHYDNQKHINFDAQLLSLPNGTQIALDINTDTGYGIVVRR